jgi:exodeoxyribonuclease VII large subunit
VTLDLMPGMGGARAVLTVSELTGYIQAVLESDDLLAAVQVRGELSNFKHHSSGHMYFTLKDGGATLRCVMFRRHADQLRFRPADGMRVLATGRVGVYVRDGQYQLYADYLQADGTGELYDALERLKKQLQAEGLFAPERKRPLPYLPRAVGVVTSGSGAAWRDIIHVAQRRHPGVPLILVPVAVQGVNAAQEISAGIRLLHRAPVPVDVMIVGRGGGSLEELWAFNEEPVVRAIAASEIPVISAVGHETDFTLADLAADVRAATPSAAAELAVPEYAVEMSRLQEMAGSMRRALVKWWESRRERLHRLGMELVAQRLVRWWEQEGQFLDQMTRRLRAAMLNKCATLRTQQEALAGCLQALSPLAVLARGYSLSRRWDGTVIRRAQQVSIGERIKIILGQGELACVVQVKEE